MAILNNSNAISSGGYDINNSLRFRASASAYLKRTPSASGNQQTWTWSGWVKRGALGSSQQIFASDNSSTSQARLNFTTSDTLSFLSYIGAFQIQLVTTQVFRDPSAWYHIVLVLDTTNATASNRTKIYVNGTQVTAFGTATYSAQNYNGVVNSNLPYYLGSYFNATSGEFLDGYMTEVNFIDGQALTPSSFGETDATTGSWIAKKYTGTYGTNGFYLKFSDIATTSGSNAGLGKDFSGNGNYWNTNNISVTAGTTYDAMIDSPTLTSATVANYAVLNPLDKGSGQTITEANLYLSAQSGGGIVKSSIAYPTSGKWYLEWTYNGSFNNIGIATLATLASTTYAGSASTTWGYYSGDGKIYTNSVGTAYGATWNTAGTVIGVAFDADAGTLTFYKNGVSQGTAVTGLTTTQYIFIAGNDSGMAGYANFGQRPFSYTPPTGFVRLNTYNLPDSTIKKGNTVMDATTYTGNGTGQSVVNAGTFKPDLVWVKSRSTADWHQLVDSRRGVGTVLFTNSTAGDQSYPTSITAFNSNGFTVGADTAGGWNLNGTTIVGWQWQAGQGSTTTGTGTGGITSVTQSVNATAGFSIVTYTGSGANGTVTHGLGVAPKMIIVKNRGSAVAWTAWHTSIANTQYLVLNTTAAVATGATWWNSTSPTSSVFSVGTSTSTNASTNTYVAYCWSEIAGFSKFGSYTGNGSTDGPFVYLGFRPKYVIFKRTDAVNNWQIQDAVRNPYNATDARIYANLSDAEAATSSILDLCSNGFKIRASGTDNNASGGTYIYAAFAENPFKNSNAR